MDSLAAERRRQLLFSLVDTQRVDGVCDDPEAWCAGCDSEDFRVALYHVHLPKLADHGLVEWDREADAVARGPAFEEVLPLLEVVATDERTHATNYC